MLHLEIKGDGEDNDPKGRAVVCIDRRSQTARILEYDICILERACIVLKAMQIEAVEVLVTPTTVADLETVGFTDRITYARRILNGKISPARSLFSVPSR